MATEPVIKVLTDYVTVDGIRKVVFEGDPDVLRVIHDILVDIPRVKWIGGVGTSWTPSRLAMFLDVLDRD